MSKRGTPITLGTSYLSSSILASVNNTDQLVLTTSAGPPQLLRNPLLWLQHLVTPYSATDREGLKRMQWFRNDGKSFKLSILLSYLYGSLS